MRFDKFTTKFQQALSDAQSLAVGADNQFIEPQHLLLALLNDAESGAGSLLARAGGNVNALKAALNEAVETATYSRFWSLFKASDYGKRVPTLLPKVQQLVLEGLERGAIALFFF